MAGWASPGLGHLGPLAPGSRREPTFGRPAQQHGQPHDHDEEEGRPGDALPS